MTKRFSLFLSLVLTILISATNSTAAPTATNSSYFILKVYHYSNASQEASLDSFLQYQYLPSLHAAKLNNIGVFKAWANDTAADKRTYVFIPFKSLKQWESVASNLM